MPYNTVDTPCVSVISEMFPHPVGAAAVRLPGDFAPLFREEERAIVGVVAGRKVEFSAGRHCARIAMQQIGHPPCAIPRGLDRAPIWPLGLTGSIAHDANYCVAVVASTHHYAAIGFDLQSVGEVTNELVRHVIRPDEMPGLDMRARPNSADWPTLHFCLKEAAYKVFYPIFKQVIDFRQMRVFIDPLRREFRAEPVLELAISAAAFKGRYEVKEGKIFAACWCCAS